MSTVNMTVSLSLSEVNVSAWVTDLPPRVPGKVDKAA